MTCFLVCLCRYFRRRKRQGALDTMIAGSTEFEPDTKPLTQSDSRPLTSRLVLSSSVFFFKLQFHSVKPGRQSMVIIRYKMNSKMQSMYFSNIHLVLSALMNCFFTNSLKRNNCSDLLLGLDYMHAIFGNFQWNR